VTPQQIQAVKAQLDSVLASRTQNVGIALGSELFRELVNAGHIVKKDFGFLGTTIWTESLPAYGNHYAFSDWELPTDGFKVGQDT
jgi:hypothetical protein